jgi:hypothetical protein
MDTRKLRPLVNNPGSWDSLEEYVKEGMELASKFLENAVQIEDIYRLQGQLKVYRNLLALKDKVNAEQN